MINGSWYHKCDMQSQKNTALEQRWTRLTGQFRFQHESRNLSAALGRAGRRQPSQRRNRKIFGKIFGCEFMRLMYNTYTSSPLSRRMPARSSAVRWRVSSASTSPIRIWATAIGSIAVWTANCLSSRAPADRSSTSKRCGAAARVVVFCRHCKTKYNITQLNEW